MNTLFQNTFEITEIDPHGKKFDKVSRIMATSSQTDLQLTIDINTEIYPLAPNTTIELVLATLDNPALLNQSIKDFDYVMYGKVYKYNDVGNSRTSVYCSFGGLLMLLAGDYRQLQAISVGQYLYLMIRK